MIAGDEPAELGGRWKSGVVLKRDVFSTVERGRFQTDGGEVNAVLRSARANHYRMISPGILAEDGRESTGIMIADPDGPARLLESTRHP